MQINIMFVCAVEDKASEVLEKLRGRLRGIEEEIEERNQGLAIPHSLRPSRVPAGTAVSLCTMIYWFCVILEVHDFLRNN